MYEKPEKLSTYLSYFTYLNLNFMLLHGGAVIASGQHGHLGESRDVLGHHDAGVERLAVGDLRVDGEVVGVRGALLVDGDHVGEHGLHAGAHGGQAVALADHFHAGRAGDLAVSGHGAAARLRNVLFDGALAAAALAHARADRVDALLHRVHRNPRAEDVQDFFEFLQHIRNSL
jgi:hypothetical protein